MQSWREDPDTVIAAELIDQAHDYDKAAKRAPRKEVAGLRATAAKCRAMAWEITHGKASAP